MRKHLLIVLTILISAYGQAAIKPKKKKANYRTYFGQCPSKVAGDLTLSLMNVFEKNGSLKSVKEYIIKEDVKSKYYLSDYKISFDPMTNLIKFSYECPKPLMKVQIYKENGIESYGAILVDNGQLYDPTYEVLLRSDNKLKKSLPSLALPVGEIDKTTQTKVTELLNLMTENFRSKLAEVILNEDNELTIILSIKRKPASAFLGKQQWEEKVLKLEKIIDYMKEKRKVPTIINLTNSKKVVVKFSDKF